MFKNCVAALVFAGTIATAGGASAAVITYTDTILAGGASISSGGLSLNTTTVGGNISTIASGTFAGLWLGGDNSSGAYTLTFGATISSIEIEFDALSSIGTLPVETLFNFATDGSGVSIGYTNQFGTTFDGTTISSTENDGQGIITFAGGSFTSFSFFHNQGAQSGFVIERIVVDTGPATEVVPLPAGGLLLLSGLGMAAALRRRRK